LISRSHFGSPIINNTTNKRIGKRLRVPRIDKQSSNKKGNKIRLTLLKKNAILNPENKANSLCSKELANC
jgi:hypothetical protein